MPEEVSSRGVADVRTRSEFGRELTRVRQDAGLTVRDVARAVGVPASTLGGYFAGTHLPPIKPPDLLRRILHACGLTDTSALEQWELALARARRAPGPRPTGAPVPYRGLAHFEVAHAEWFHGRERSVADLVNRIVENADGGLLTVVGASGSGKSSLLHAGLLAALATEPMARHWGALSLTPGPQPVLALAAQLAPLVGDPAHVVAKTLAADPQQLGRLIATGSRPNGSPHSPRRTVLVIDQFEEVFTSCQDEAERAAFIHAISAAAAKRAIPTSAGKSDGESAGGSSVVVVLGLRADFYGAALRYPQIMEALQHKQTIVGPMTSDEVRRAIVEPARRAKVDLDEALVDVLMRDLDAGRGESLGAAHDAGALPLLSHALLATWRRGQSSRLTVADYRETGGIRGAVAHTAEEAYTALTPTQQTVARRLFLRLVHVTDESADTRRYVPHAEVRLLGRDARYVADAFIGCRLLTAEVDRITITHEALLFAWPRLRSWIDGDRAGLRVHRQLTAAASTWQEHGRDPHALYGGGRLSVASEWATDPAHLADLTSLEREFLDASTAHQAAEQRATRRRSRIARRLVAALTVLSVLAVASAGYALRQKETADAQRNLAIARQIATVADQVRAKDVALGRQLALAAYRIAPIRESRSALLNSYGSPAVTRLLGPAGVMQTIALSPNGALMAAAGGARTIQLWNMPHSGRPVPVTEPLTGHTDTVYSIAFSPTGHLLASAGGDRTIRLWDVSDPERPSAIGTAITDPTNTIYSLAFGPDGHTLAAGSADNTVRLYDVTSPSRPLPLGPPLAGFTGYVQAVAFSPDGGLLAAGGADNTVRLWTVRDPRGPVPTGDPLRGPTKTVYSVAFSPDGRSLAAGSADGAVHLWSLTTPARPAATGKLTGPSSWVNSVAFSPDGKRIAAASSDSNLWVWDTASRELVLLQRHPAPLTAVVFASGGSSNVVTACADGAARRWQISGPLITKTSGNVFTTSFAADHTLAVTSVDNTGSLWHVANPRQPTPAGPPLRGVNTPDSTSGAAALSPNAHIIATGDRSGAVQLWDVADPRRPALLPRRLSAHTATIQSVAFSADGRLLAVGSNDGTISLWDLTRPEYPVRLGQNIPGPGNYVLTVAISPDGRTLAAGGADNTARLWDITEPVRPEPIGSTVTGPTRYVYSVAFSPDNRLLALGSADNTIRLYDIAGRREAVPLGDPLTGPDNYVYSIAFNAEPGRLAAGAGDGTIWLWDISDARKPEPYATITAHEKATYVVAFDGDSPILASGSADQTARLWNVDPERVATEICATTGDGITRAEWNKYLANAPYTPPCP